MKLPAFLHSWCVTAVAAIALSWLVLSNPAVADERYKVVTTFTLFADITRQIGGDRVQVHSITKPGADIHSYQPTPRDILAAQDAQLILWHGMNLELWFEKFYRNLPQVPKVQITQGIEPLGISEGSYRGKPNPHAWMSAQNAAIYIDNIRRALSELDPEGEAVYRANAERYTEQVVAMMERFKQALTALPEERRWLVSSEGAFSYLARDLGLKELYIWPINADAQATPQQMRRVIDKVRSEQIPAVFSESTVSDKPAKQVAKEADSRYGGVLYVDSLSAPDGPVPDYLSLLRVTGETIVEGLLGE